MTWIQKKVTPAVLDANRSNSRKSTGPQTALGKRRVSRNAGKYFVFGQITPSRMKELGEDPAEFEKLRQSLRTAIRPRDGLEETLIEEMAVNRWRLGRLRRAETGILAMQQMKLDHVLALDRANSGASADNLMLHYYGLTGAAESQEKYVQILQLLGSLLEKTEKEGFCPEGLKLLETVYGTSPGVTGLALITQYMTQLGTQKGEKRSQPTADEQRARESFLSNLAHEMNALGEHLEAFKLMRNMPLPEPFKDSQLIPSEKDLDRLMRYEVMLQREFERTQKQLLDWRSRRREAPNP